MATELFSVVALPHSVADGADYHVSLFVSPRLTPDVAEATFLRTARERHSAAEA